MCQHVEPDLTYVNAGLAAGCARVAEQAVKTFQVHDR